MMDANVPLVAIALSRKAGQGLALFEAYADGETTDPSPAHVAVAYDGRFLDDNGLRTFAEVVSGLKGATFRARSIDEAEALRLAVAGSKRSTVDVEARAEAILECLRDAIAMESASQERPSPRP